MQGRRTRVLVIGLDGATWRLMAPWIEKGELPTLRKIATEGVVGELKSTLMPLSPTAWSSFLTGTNPGKHGIFDFTVREREGYGQVPISSGARQGVPLWEVLGRAGKRVGFINVPGTYPPSPVNGFMISGFPTPESRGDHIYPPQLREELRSVLGDIHLQPVDFHGEMGMEAFLSDQYRCLENLLKVTRYLVRKREWDFLMAVIGQTDSFGHALWHCLDPSHPRYRPELSEKYAPHMLEVYQKADNFLGEILDLLDEDTSLIIMSDHGSAPLYYTLYLNNWLVEEGYMRFKRDALTRLKVWAFKHGWTLSRAFLLTQRLGLARYGVRAAIGVDGGMPSAFIVGLLNRLFLSFNDVDWPSTVAYSTGYFGQIYINLSGREPQGTVEPGQEYERLVREIVGKLKRLKDPRHGQLIFSQVLTKEEIYSGEYLDRAPDILFYDQAFTYSAARFFEFGTNQLVTPQVTGRAGGHDLWGILAMKGESLRQGAKIKGAQIIDLAPTILYLLGVPVPTCMEGKVIEQALPPSFLAENSITYQDVEDVSLEKGEERPFSPEEEEEIRKQLRGLGYLGY